MTEQNTGQSNVGGDAPSASWKDYFYLARLDKPIGAWLLWIPCLWGIFLAPSASWPKRLWLAFLFGLGSVVMRAAGCVINDMWDRDIDRHVQRTRARPLASGRIGFRQAVWFLVVLLLLGAGVLTCLNRLSWLCCLAVMPFVVLYPLAKRFIWCPQLILGIAFGSGSFISFAATSGHLSADALCLYAGAISWIVGYDTIYGFQDMVDDAKLGVKSFSRLIAKHPKPILSCCFLFTSISLGVGGWLAAEGWPFWLFWLLGSVLLFRQIWLLDIHDSQLCGRQFLESRDIGLVFGLAFILGLVTQ